VVPRTHARVPPRGVGSPSHVAGPLLSAMRYLSQVMRGAVGADTLSSAAAVDVPDVGVRPGAPMPGNAPRARVDGARSH